MWTNMAHEGRGMCLCELTALGFVTRPHCSAVVGSEVERLLRLHGPERSAGCVLYRHCQCQRGVRPSGEKETDGRRIGTSNKEQRHQQNQLKFRLLYGTVIELTQ
jgi:hypothetical protein